MTDPHLAAVRARFDTRAAGYDESAMHRALAAEAVAFAGVADGSDVLDVATGTGLVLRALRDAGVDARLTGVDLSPGMLAVARAALPGATFVEADATVLPLPDASADVVFCVTGLHLFPEPGAAVAEWARVLRPGGRAVTATFGRMDPAVHGAAHRGAAPLPFPPRHDLFDTPEKLAAAVAPAGFGMRATRWWTAGDDRVLLAELVR